MHEVPTGGVPRLDDPHLAKDYLKHDGRGVPGAPLSEAVDSRVRKHSHYFKDVSHLDTVDVYRVLSLFNVTDQALGHAIKKLLVAGGRGAGKDVTRDVQEAADTLQRFLEMRNEDCIGE